MRVRAGGSSDLCALVIVVAVVIGFRPDAGIAAWLTFGPLLVLFTLATTWLAVFFGLLARTVEGAGAFSYILLLLIFISPSFVPTVLDPERANPGDEFDAARSRRPRRPSTLGRSATESTDPAPPQPRMKR